MNRNIIPLTPAADYSSSEGKLVDIAASTATISTSATTVAKGVITAGNPTSSGYATEQVSVQLLGGGGPVRMRASGTITKGAFVIQSTDGTVITDPGTGARVVQGVALENAVSGENILVNPCQQVHHATES